MPSPSAHLPVGQRLEYGGDDARALIQAIPRMRRHEEGRPGPRGDSRPGKRHPTRIDIQIGYLLQQPSCGTFRQDRGVVLLIFLHLLCNYTLNITSDRD